MAEETFRCDRCGREFPRRQLKEAFSGAGEDRQKMNLCPECVDAVMNESGNVRGIPGDEKRAAVVVGEGDSPRESFGERGSG